MSTATQEPVFDATKTVVSAHLKKKLTFDSIELEDSIEKHLLQKKPNISDNARVVLEKRYLLKDDTGVVIEKPEDLFFRVAQNIAQAELLFNPDAKIGYWIEQFYNVMTDMDFLPNSPTLMNAGRDLQQLSACFVLPVGDSMEEIFESVKNTALIHKSGGGTGFSFSGIRPRNDMVKSTKGVSSGPLSFMRVFDIATETVKQGGTRRGANMGILSCHHPEIMDFVGIKEKDGVLSNFNISVGITREFMDALKRDAEYPLRNPRSKEIVGYQKASVLFKRMVDLAWSNGEPGMVFLDKINAENPTPHLGEIESTNPCGEQPLLPYESCNLGSLNLSHMTTTDKEGHTTIDWEHLGHVVGIAVRFLDDVIEVNRYPLPQIDKVTKGNRKIGLGVMGFADMLITLGIQYNSPAAAAMAEEIMKFIQEEGRKMSAFLATERGVFPCFEGSIFDKKIGLRVRNATVTTIAPTGTISMIAGCSSGIEPLFAVAYEKNVLDNHLLEIHPEFLRIAHREGFYSDELMDMVAKSGTLGKCYGIPKRIRDIFVTAHDIEARWHLQIQASFQKYTDNAVSKTINLRHNATQKDVEEAFLYAYELNCKGITVYRDGTRNSQVMTVGAGSGSASEGGKVVAAGGTVHPRPRPPVTQGYTYKTKTGCGNLYVNINADSIGPCEVFTQMGKSGGCAASNSEAVSRLVSLALRSGIEPKHISEQLRGIRCPVPTWNEGTTILSCADAIGRVFEKAIEQHEHDKAGGVGEIKKITYEKLDLGLCPQCPECGSMMEHQEGCAVCKSCGYSKCS